MKIKDESEEYYAVRDAAAETIDENYYAGDDYVLHCSEALDHLIEIDPEGFDVPEDSDIDGNSTQATFDKRQEKIYQLSVEVANEVASNYPDMESTGA